jgi:hypothetical protein
MGDKDIISKELLKEMARDISRHILHIEIDDNMELIDCQVSPRCSSLWKAIA